jgi:hypothetical protein
MTTDTRHSRWVLALAAAASLIVALDTLVVTTALSTIRLDLGASIAELEWTVNAYNLSALARKFADVFGQAAWAAGSSSLWARRSRSARVNFHSNGVAICS